MPIMFYIREEYYYTPNQSLMLHSNIIRPWSGTIATAEGDIGNIKPIQDMKKEGRECSNQFNDGEQKPFHLLESIAGHLNNDRPIKLETFHKLSVCLKQHFKIKFENDASTQNQSTSEDTISNLMSIVNNVIGMNNETIDNDQSSSHYSTLSGKDQEMIILLGKLCSIWYHE